MGAPDRDIARRIAQAFLLLEGRVVFFIDHDQLQARHGHEHRQPGTEHNRRLSALRREKTARARRIAHAAVGADNVRAGKARRDAALELRRQRDFRNQHQRLAATRQHGGDGAQIDFGLAAAGNAVQQHRVKASGRGDDRDRVLLGGQKSGQTAVKSRR